jgi:hypothetical protein
MERSISYAMNGTRPSSATTSTSASSTNPGINPHQINSPTSTSKCPSSRPKSAPTKRLPCYWRPALCSTPRQRNDAEGAGVELFSTTPPCSARSDRDRIATRRPTPPDELAATPRRSYLRLSLGNGRGAPTVMPDATLAVLRRALAMLRAPASGEADEECAVSLLGTLDLSAPATASAFVLEVSRRRRPTGLLSVSFAQHHTTHSSRTSTRASYSSPHSAAPCRKW